jgi:uncharacterized protein (DUF952 family)
LPQEQSNKTTQTCNTLIIYHITDDAHWRPALQTGLYTHESLGTEGFIHGCIKSQLPDVLARHFASASSVLLLHIVDKRVKKMLKWADLQYGYYPHFHGKIPVEAISDLSILSRRTDGTWDFDNVRLD